MTAAPRVGDTVTSASEVRGLRAGTILRTHEGQAARAVDGGLRGEGWFLRGRVLEARHLPATVLYLPPAVATLAAGEVVVAVSSRPAAEGLRLLEQQATRERRSRAETTTATEAAASVLTEHRFHGSSCLGCNYNARLDGYRASMHQAQALADAGLLATAPRTVHGRGGDADGVQWVELDGVRYHRLDTGGES